MLKNFIKQFKNNLVAGLVKPVKIIEPKTLLLIRLDAIGDYILFRKCIAELKHSAKYRDYSITLVGNIVWKDLAEHFDKPYLEDIIWIDRKRFIRNLFYQYQIVKKLTRQGYDVLISPIYSRDFFYEDFLVKIINATTKIGSSADLSHISKKQKLISNDYYTQIISADSAPKFEFLRNREFIEKAIHSSRKIKNTCFTKKELDNLPESKWNKPVGPYLVFGVGASKQHFRWSIDHFLALAQFISQTFAYSVVICGTMADKNIILNNNSMESLPHVVDLMGQTSLVETAEILRHARLVVANESMMPHLAVAVGTEVLVISEGTRYGRFHPYPQSLAKQYHIVYPPEIEELLQQKSYQEILKKYHGGSTLNINSITVKQVQQKVELILGESKV